MRPENKNDAFPGALQFPQSKINYIRLGDAVGSAPACRTGSPGSNPGPGENFSFKLRTQVLPNGYSENQIFINNFAPMCL